MKSYLRCVRGVVPGLLFFLGVLVAFAGGVRCTQTNPMAPAKPIVYKDKVSEPAGAVPSTRTLTVDSQVTLDTAFRVDTLTNDTSLWYRKRVTTVVESTYIDSIYSITRYTDSLFFDIDTLFSDTVVWFDTLRRVQNSATFIYDSLLEPLISQYAETSFVRIEISNRRSVSDTVKRVVDSVYLYSPDHNDTLLYYIRHEIKETRVLDDSVFAISIVKDSTYTSMPLVVSDTIRMTDIRTGAIDSAFAVLRRDTITLIDSTQIE